MSPNMQMEQFSLAYIRAVAAQAGYRIGVAEPDWDSMDGVLISDTGRRPRIEFQAKATGRDIFTRDGNLSFPLDVGNYNNLRVPTPIIPRILIVVLVPSDIDDWLSQSESELCLRRCAYWTSLEGYQAVPNSSTVNITIPANRIFNREQLDSMMESADGGEPL